MTSIIQPTYITKQPSTGKPVKYRPFTVKEEKSLLLALQEDDPATIALAVKNIISSCLFGELDPEIIPYYDVEYLFLQIRSKSVGEIIDLIGTCECGTTTEFNTDIADVEITPKPPEKNIIKIVNTNYSIAISHPSISDFSKTFDISTSTATDVVANCIQSVFTDEEIMDWSMKQKQEFVESMTPIQQKDVVKFLKEMPMVKLPTNYVCKNCKKKHESFMTGFENFFV